MVTSTVVSPGKHEGESVMPSTAKPRSEVVENGQAPEQAVAAAGSDRLLSGVFVVAVFLLSLIHI